MGVKDLEDLKKISMLRSQIDGITVGEILITDFPSVKSEDKMSDVLSVMRDSGFQEIPIIDEGNYVGMVSYGSILKKRSVTPDTKVKNLVRNLPTLTTSTEITKIAELMVMNNCRQLAVLNGKKVLGIVSRTGLTKIAARMKALKDIRVWEIMTTPVEFLRENAMLDDALDIMRRLDIRTVPVVNNADKIIGIVGMKEIIDNYWKSENKIFGDFEKSSKAQILIESVCSTTVVTTDWGSDMGTAAQIMEDGHFSTLPVVDGEELVGIITEYDIIELINACRDRDALFVQISGLEEDDKEYAESMYSDIASEIAKISKIYKPESLIMHVSRYNESGEKKKYSIIGKLFIDGTTINAKEVGWDLIQTNAALIRKIGDMVVNMKETKTTFRRRKK